MIMLTMTYMDSLRSPVGTRGIQVLLNVGGLAALTMAPLPSHIETLHVHVLSRSGGKYLTKNNCDIKGSDLENAVVRDLQIAHRTHVQINVTILFTGLSQHPFAALRGYTEQLL